MPRGGATIFGDLVGRLDVLRVSCAKCDRRARYNVRWLIEDHGRDVRVTDWLVEITADCPRKRSINMRDQCAVRCPDLSKMR